MNKNNSSKFGKRFGMAMKGLLSGLGIMSVPTASFSTPSFEDASLQNTVGAYTAFIISGGDRNMVEEAFCRLAALDTVVAGQAALSYTNATGTGVGLEVCAITGSARLFTI